MWLSFPYYTPQHRQELAAGPVNCQATDLMGVN